MAEVKIRCEHYMVNLHKTGSEDLEGYLLASSTTGTADKRYEEV